MDSSEVVALVGPKDAGKTSLIACLFELFQRNDLAPIAFAGTQTPCAFEQACHKSRSVSRRQKPDTDRTSQRDPIGFYHLRIRHCKGQIRSILLADRAGEQYRRITDDLQNAIALVEVRRAGVVALLIDGERLSDLKQRHQLRTEMIAILSALVESQLVHEHQRLALVLTKADCFFQAQDQDRVQRDFSALISELSSILHTFGSVEIFKTAASPKASTVRRGLGLVELFAYITKAVPPRAVTRPDRLTHGPKRRMFWSLVPEECEHETA